MVSLATQPHENGNPIDLIEELVMANDWAFDRASESEMVVEIAGRWCSYHLCFVWDIELQAVFFSCHLDVKTTPASRRAVAELLAKANERLWLGHFELSHEDGLVSYRHTLPLRGTAGMAADQLEDLVDCGVGESERFYPALQLVVWGGRDPDEALQTALMDTVGEA